MKNLSNILRRSSITPFERIKTLVHNDIHKEKTGESMLSESEIYVLRDSWNPRAIEAKEYNRYAKMAQIEDTMKMDAQMFLHRAEIALLRNQRVLDSFTFRTTLLKVLSEQEFLNDIPREESIQFLTQNTYLEYKRLLHIFTFNNLPKEIQDDLALLDDCVAYDKRYLDEEVFLYEKFKNGTELSQQDKSIIIDRIYSGMYYEGAKKIKNSTSEKDGFILHNFFADLPTKDIFKKIAHDIHIKYKDDDFENTILLGLEEYAKSKNMSMESLVKDALSRWLDEGLFVNDYSPTFMSERFDTWNGNTKKNHKELFTAWYTELKKSEQVFQSLFDTKKLEKGSIEIEILGMKKTLEIVTGTSLLACKENLLFISEYKQQVEMLLPVANMYLFVKKHAYPVKSYRTLCEFKNLAEKFSIQFDIDVTEQYTYFIDSYKEEIVLLNHSIGRLLDIATEYLYTEKTLTYILDISDESFLFNLEGNDEPVDIIGRYTEEFKKLGL